MNPIFLIHSNPQKDKVPIFYGNDPIEKISNTRAQLDLKKTKVFFRNLFMALSYEELADPKNKHL